MALKTFRRGFLPDRATQDRFLREGNTWINLGWTITDLAGLEKKQCIRPRQAS